MTEIRVSSLAVATGLNDMQIMSTADYARWCLAGNAPNVASEVVVNAARPGDYTDHATTWTIKADDSGDWFEVKHNRTAGYVAVAEAAGGKADAQVVVRPNKDNDYQKWWIQEYDHPQGGKVYSFNSKLDEDLSVAAVPLFHGLYGTLLLRKRKRDEWPNYLFRLDYPDRWRKHNH